jgi:hypothetical protein
MATILNFRAVSGFNAHRAPDPAPEEDPVPEPRPIPVEEPVPDHNPSTASTLLRAA